MPRLTPLRLKLRQPAPQPPAPLGFRPRPAASPLVLCDHLITLAQEADRAGYPATAGHLVALVDRVFEEQRVGR